MTSLLDSRWSKGVFLKETYPKYSYRKEYMREKQFHNVNKVRNIE